MSETMTELKALVGKKGSRYEEAPTLYVSTDNESRVWATNKYWLVNAERMRPMFADYNLPIETGRYEVNGKVVPVAGDAPNVNGLIPSPDWSEISRVMVADRAAYVRTITDDPACSFVALFDNDGTTVAVNDRYLSFVIGDAGPVTFRQPRATMPVAVYRSTDPVQPTSADLLGLVMPVRL